LKSAIFGLAAEPVELGFLQVYTKVSIDNGYRVLAQLIGLRKLNKSESSKLAEPDSALV
jgi:hypothetical protein